MVDRSASQPITMFDGWEGLGVGLAARSNLMVDQPIIVTSQPNNWFVGWVRGFTVQGSKQLVGRFGVAVRSCGLVVDRGSVLRLHIGRFGVGCPEMRTYGGSRIFSQLFQVIWEITFLAGSSSPSGRAGGGRAGGRRLPLPSGHPAPLIKTIPRRPGRRAEAGLRMQP